MNRIFVLAMVLFFLLARSAQANYTLASDGYYYDAAGYRYTKTFVASPVYRNGCYVSSGYYTYTYIPLAQTTTINNTTTIEVPRDWKNTILDTAKSQDDNVTYLKALAIVAPPVSGVLPSGQSSSGSYYGSTYNGPLGFYGSTAAGYTLGSLISPDPNLALNLAAQAHGQWVDGAKQANNNLHQSLDTVTTKESEVRKFIGAAQALKTVLGAQSGTVTTQGGTYQSIPTYPAQPAQQPQVQQPTTQKLSALQIRQARCGSCHSTAAKNDFSRWDKMSTSDKMNTIWMRINSPDPNIHMPRTPDGNVYDLPAEEKALLQTL